MNDQRTGQALAMGSRWRATRRRSHEVFVRAMELSRAALSPGPAVAELRRLCDGDTASVDLARGYCRALLGLMPGDRHVAGALRLLLAVGAASAWPPVGNRAA